MNTDNANLIICVDATNKRLWVGPVPINVMEADSIGATQLNPNAARHLGASFACCAPDDMLSWVQDLRPETVEAEGIDRWLLCGEVGVSALTIVSVLGTQRQQWAANNAKSRNDAPYDGADLRRCVDMLNEAPDDWRSRLVEVAGAHPVWAGFAQRWAELEQTLAEEMREGVSAPRTFALISQIRGKR